MSLNKSSKGFTLIELLVVVAIIGISGAFLFDDRIMDNNALNEGAVNICLMEGELPLLDCQINADYLYPKQQLESNYYNQ